MNETISPSTTAPWYAEDEPESQPFAIINVVDRPGEKPFREFALVYDQNLMLLSPRQYVVVLGLLAGNVDLEEASERLSRIIGRESYLSENNVSKILSDLRPQLLEIGLYVGDASIGAGTSATRLKIRTFIEIARLRGRIANPEIGVYDLVDENGAMRFFVDGSEVRRANNALLSRQQFILAKILFAHRLEGDQAKALQNITVSARNRRFQTVWEELTQGAAISPQNLSLHITVLREALRPSKHTISEHSAGRTWDAKPYQLVKLEEG